MCRLQTCLLWQQAHTHKKTVCLIFRRLAELFVLVAEIIDWICCRLFCLLSLSVWVSASGLTVSDQLVSYMYFLFSLSRSKKSSKKRNRRTDGNCEYMILIVSMCNVTNWLQWNSHSRWLRIWWKLSHHPSLEFSRHMSMPEAENVWACVKTAFSNVHVSEKGKGWGISAVTLIVSSPACNLHACSAVRGLTLHQNKPVACMCIRQWGG